jgi:tRNA threonylcarbamoyladenosine biosynthesis protein TsaB
MSLILNIDTATETARLSIAKDGVILKDAINKEQKDHAAFVQPAIKELLAGTGLSFAAIDAVAVMIGPGSYTGIRVGMASAKGLCYALNKPLIAVNTLESMAMAAAITLSETDKQTQLLCPMIDARREEVYTAIYDHSLNILLPPGAIILDTNSYAEFLDKHTILFFGTGSDKWEKACLHPNARFQCVNIDPNSMAILSVKKFSAKDAQFDDPAYLEPLYIKEFYTNQA